MNQALKNEIRNSRLYNHEIAAYLGVSESTLYRWLRSNLSSNQKEKIAAAIEECKKNQLLHA
ncbi:helix-turn-helix domain-containing protein [Bacillus testis]|uniref:helix-turn-helix domain-containing protein n=1 Tax=Bacillus testis TaxID=1622072 RepID=UPI00067EB07E|nr:helix-turn-helix domain-containing protein [Bacillus testis]